jgi:hypothetical protein
MDIMQRVSVHVDSRTVAVEVGKREKAVRVRKRIAAQNGPLLTVTVQVRQLSWTAISCITRDNVGTRCARRGRFKIPFSVYEIES